VVSPRNQEKSIALHADYPDIIEIAESNEAVVANSTIVFIGLLPEVARAVLPTLPFTDNHKIVSMMAAVNYDEVVSLCRAKPENVVKIVPLPAAARRSGPILFHPPHTYLEKIVGVVGVPAAVEHESDMKPLISVTGHISAFYQLMGTTQDWIVDQGTMSVSVSTTANNSAPVVVLVHLPFTRCLSLFTASCFTLNAIIIQS
jgi:pyrroline-5-carboxylate reductase